MLRYGDEIGMGENLGLHERDAIRTPMQWASTRNAGFSSAPPERLVVPVIGEGEFGYPKVNVADEQRGPDSLLNWTEHMTRLRLRSPEFGYGECEWLETSDPAILAHSSRADHSCVFAIHNLSGREVDVSVKLGRKVDGLFDLLANREARKAKTAIIG